jgi:HPt (histidine-containing phosphotransfer) domain-containing protein
MADNVVYINFDEGVKRVMNNAAFYIKLLTKFDSGTNLDDLEAALAAGEMEKAQIAVHTLKGTAANLSLTELYTQSLELETQIKAKNVNPNQIITLKDVFTQTLAEIKKVITQND